MPLTHFLLGNVSFFGKQTVVPPICVVPLIHPYIGYIHPYIENESFFLFFAMALTGHRKNMIIMPKMNKHAETRIMNLIR